MPYDHGYMDSSKSYLDMATMLSHTYLILVFTYFGAAKRKVFAWKTGNVQKMVYTGPIVIANCDRQSQ